VRETPNDECPTIKFADVLCYALARANELQIDLASAVREKMVKNAQKYPADEFRGRFGRTIPKIRSSFILAGTVVTLGTALEQSLSSTSR
jgi:hypothetical protein